MHLQYHIWYTVSRSIKSLKVRTHSRLEISDLLYWMNGIIDGMCACVMNIVRIALLFDF